MASRGGGGLLVIVIVKGCCGHTGENLVVCPYVENLSVSIRGKPGCVSICEKP